MKLDVFQLSRQTRLKLTGDESWLGGIYDTFLTPSAEASSKINGELQLTPDGQGSVEVRGQLTYQPFVACSHCAEGITWPISLEFKVLYRQPPQDFSDRKEVNLERDELDHYYIIDNAINLEELVNDQIQMAIPTRTVKASEDGKSCLICLDNLDGFAVYEESKETPTNPFSILGKLKQDN